jgi:uncharacterized Zn-binding protein involved in type VI secretion
MPAVARQGDMGVIHGSPFTIISGSPDVNVNNKPAARQGDRSSFHKKHSSTIQSGSPTVFVNNRPLARVGDPLVQCTKVQTGSGDVFAG